jgi:hypothetical protein
MWEPKRECKLHTGKAPRIKRNITSHLVEKANGDREEMRKIRSQELDQHRNRMDIGEQFTATSA